LRFDPPLPPRWEGLIDDALRLPGSGALPALVFDPARFIVHVNGRPVFRPAKDAVLLHLGHPIFRQTLAVFARARFAAGDSHPLSTRWTARHGVVPDGADALILLTVEELAVNELREPFHHWLRTVRFPVAGGLLGEPLPYLPPASDVYPERVASGAALRRAQDLWDEVAPELKARLDERSLKLTAEVGLHLAQVGKQALEAEKERFEHRRREVERAMGDNTLARLERERDKHLSELRATIPYLEVEIERIRRQIGDLETEIERRKNHYEDLLHLLEREEARILENVLPRRYALRGEAQVFPVAVEVRLPEGTR
jgi:hypothetical protein